MRALFLSTLLVVLSHCGGPGEGPSPAVCTSNASCADGQLCQAGVCVASTGCEAHEGNPPNLLANGSFECASSDAWRTSPTESAQFEVVASPSAKAGGKVGKVTAPSDASAASVWYANDAVVKPETRSYCATVWVRGTAQVGRLNVRKAAPGQNQDEEFSVPLTGEWQSIPPPGTGPMLVTGKGEERFLLRVYIPQPKAGEWMELDGVRLWETTTGSCK